MFSCLSETNVSISFTCTVAPTIKKPPKIVSVFNRKVVMECVVMSTSKPACNWFKDATKVRLDTRHCVNILEVSSIRRREQLRYIKREIVTQSGVRIPCPTMCFSIILFLRLLKLLFHLLQEGEGKYVVQMEMLKAERSDCGMYKLVAKNEKGETTSQTVELIESMLEEVSLAHSYILRVEDDKGY